MTDQEIREQILRVWTTTQRTETVASQHLLKLPPTTPKIVRNDAMYKKGRGE